MEIYGDFWDLLESLPRLYKLEFNIAKDLGRSIVIKLESRYDFWCFSWK